MAAQESYRSPCSGHGSRNGCAVYRDKGFYDHYQIGGGGKPAEAEAEPEESEGGLTTRYVGSHSPFGIVWQLSAATGWTVRHVLWGVNYQTLRMMLADAPHYETIRHKKNNKPGGRKKSSSIKPKSTAGFFQSMLKKDNEAGRD